MVKDPQKTFVWSETCFLKRYYEDPSTSTLQILSDLIESGRLEIVGGGRVQHDETLTSYKLQLSQMEVGHKWLLETYPFLKDKIKTFWQIDPFGASSLTPLLFGAPDQDIRFEYAVMTRVGDHLKADFKKSKNMDFMWRNPFKEESSLLTHILPNHYNTLEE